LICHAGTGLNSNIDQSSSVARSSRCASMKA
jgi:hypothetical protein